MAVSFVPHAKDYRFHVGRSRQINVVPTGTGNESQVKRSGVMIIYVGGVLNVA